MMWTARCCVPRWHCRHSNAYTLALRLRQRSRLSVVSHPERADLGALIHALTEAELAFVVVGGAAAVLHGAPVTTLDLDIVPERSEENVDRLMAVLTRLNARVRDPARRILLPNRDALLGPGQCLFSTNLGPLDCLGSLHDGRSFEDLYPRSIELNDGQSTIRVVDLATLIEIKTQAGRPKDRLVVPILLGLRDELEAREAK